MNDTLIRSPNDDRSIQNTEKESNTITKRRRVTKRLTKIAKQCAPQDATEDQLSQMQSQADKSGDMKLSTDRNETLGNDEPYYETCPRSDWRLG